MENGDQKIGYPDQDRKRVVLRVLGFVFVGIGVLLLAIGLFSMTGILNDGFPGLFFLTFLGLPLLFVGAVCLMFGFFGAVSRFQAGEAAPVAKDTANYLLDGTRKETTKTVHAALQDNGPRCPKCGEENEKGAVYCDHCGASLSKTCANCGEKNDLDSTFCRKCGKRL